MASDSLDESKRALAEMVLEWAREGDPESQCKVGTMYSLGTEGLPKDEKQAVFWYRRAADQEDPDAQFYLGQCYNDGTGVALDRQEAFRCFARAAENGSCEAQQMLGLAPFVSHIDSYKWLKLSSESENEYTRAQAEAHMQVLLEDMTDTDVQLAEKDVVNWKMKRKHYARQARLSNLPVQLNEILEQFAKAHDAVFRFSLRKLFRPIDFPQLRSWLDSLLEGLEQMRSDLAAMPDEEFLVALREYMAALADAMTKLRDICYRLALKAQDPSQYTASAYSADVSSYQASVARYQQIGQAVDVHWADWEAAQTQQHVGDDALATLVADLSESESRKLVDKGVVTEDQWREWRRLRTKGKQEDSGAASEEEKGP